MIISKYNLAILTSIQSKCETILCTAYKFNLPETTSTIITDLELMLGHIGVLHIAYNFWENTAVWEWKVVEPHDQGRLGFFPHL